MNIGEKLSGLKPYAGGAAIGAIAITIAGFSFDWVVMTGTMEQKVQETRVSTLAKVCETNALAHWKEQGKEVAALDGWDNEQRANLADQFTPSIAKDADYREEIVDACDDLIRPA